jgi:chromodomain-helicase-DNA-binding protein 7
MIAGEQQAIVMLKALHSQMGENPMKYTVEQMLSEEQEHLDMLWQHMPAGVPSQQPAQPAMAAPMAQEAPMAAEGAPVAMEGAPMAAEGAPPPVEGKLASAIRMVRRKLAADQLQAMDPGAVPVPSPGSEPIEAYMQREHQLSLAQSEAEKQDLMARLSQSQQMVEQHMAAANQANQAAQQSAQQAAMASQQAAAQQQAAQDAQTAATQAQSQAAAEADGKMRLSIRLSQIRQQLADIASQDPAAEEGMGTGSAPGPGSVATAPQQQQAAQEQAMQEMAQQQMAAEQQGGPRAKKETAQAQRAQQEAEVQGQQAAVSQATGA